MTYTPGATPPRRDPRFGAGRSAIVLVASTSAARGDNPDTAGPLAVDWLRGLGYEVPAPVVVPDGEPVGAALDHYLQELGWDDRPRIIVTSGGTGLNPDDRTPQLTAARLDYQVPGIMHAIWEYGLQKVDFAVMSRGVAGVRDRTFVVNLSGSRGGVKDGITVLDTIVHHIQAQIEDLRDHRENRTGPDRGPELVMAPTAPGVASPGIASASGAAPNQGSADATRDPEEARVGAVVHTSVGTEPLDHVAAEASVTTAHTGASVVFRGTIRDHDEGRTGVTGLDYSAHPDAGRILERTVSTVAAAHPSVRIHAAHRIGHLDIGEDALVVACASAHRQAAFACCSDLVDAIKAEVPIWKQQYFAEGDHTWVGLQ
ncbi:molybdenum cofactor biosynthesis protein MoaE [Brevibacterium litoralis]|uniref:molybdenum cofactor biosynthesis protein MoaE n=1 Tax=Brevibacterium litoralis TaxID=3138935 RepID=UPI0032EBFD35